MKSLHLILGCHSHQPVGNFDFVFEEAYEKAYLPFIEVLERFPAVHFTQHYTGPLWDWFLEHRPEFVERLAALVRRGQIEIMGGAYYEPLLCAIPQRDAIAQIRRMQAFCERHFGQRPRGMWLAERVWEPGMAKTLAEAGVEYTVLDDMHFKCSGLAPDALYGYYMTEDEGRAVKVFPIQERLRYLVPFHPVHETIEHLRELASEDGLRCAVLHDDGEKFGTWPGTHHSVYEEGWLENFFQALTDNQEWLHCVTYAEYMAKTPALGRTYVTCASYQEMMAWALPTPMQRELKDLRALFEPDSTYQLYIRGGFWRNFLAKYPEANTMQKRMLRESNRLAALRARHPGDARLDEAERLLHESQCNCAYWHGVFGGLYLNHLRTAVFEKAIAAGAVLDAVEHAGAEWTRAVLEDVDADGHEEAILENAAMALYFKPADGASLYEWDFKPRPFNLLNTLARREEAYHDTLRSGQASAAGADQEQKSIHDLVWVKEEGLDAYLVYDAHRRSSLRDRFLDLEPGVDALWAGTARDYGNFAAERYVAECGGNQIVFTRHGLVQGPEPAPVLLRKTARIEPGANACEIRYDIENMGHTALACRFGVEFAVNLLSGAGPDRYFASRDRDLAFLPLGARGLLEGLEHIALHDRWLGLVCEIAWRGPAEVYHYPIETVSQSEAGQERVYQGSVVMPSWALDLPPGAAFGLTLTLAAGQTD